MKLILNNEHPQFKIFTSTEFLGFLRKRGIYVSLSYLEYYDKVELLRPVLKIKKRKDENSEYDILHLLL